MSDETNENYHADTTFVSASMLKSLDESPRIFEAKYITKTLPSRPSAAMELGTAVHCAALEPERFHTQYVTQPKGVEDRRTKAFKEWAASVHPSQTIIKRDDLETVVRCVDALRANPIIGMALNAKGVVECSHRWNDDTTAVPCKFRPDKICESAGLILDIKTMQSCSIDDFEKQLVSFRYFLQAAHYTSGAWSMYPNRESDWLFIFACVETSEPYRCRAFQMDASAFCVGHERREALLLEYKRRVKSGDWSEPGEQDLVTVSLPNWYVRRCV